jgi:ketosteroid isomerase-like protein
VQTVLAAFDPAIEWRTPASLPWSSGTYHGHDGVTAYFGAFLGELADARVEPDSIDGAGGVVVARGFERATVRSNGQRFEARFVHVWRLDGDLITAMEGVSDTAVVVAAFEPMPATA